ncbi:MAG: hypothetical protein R3F62_29285 [Planctomycetota bacterium]
MEPRVDRRLLGWVYLAALVLRGVAAARCASLSPDGVVELDQARAWALGDLAGGLEPGFSPLLSLLTAALHLLSGLPLEGLALAGVIAGSALAAPGAALAAAWLCPRAPQRAAFAAGLLAAAHPYLVRLGGQVMGYGLAHGLEGLAAGLAVRAAARGRARDAASAGAVVGLAYLARADALTIAVGLAAGLAWCGRRRLTSVVAFALAATLVASPYLLALRAHHGAWRLSGRKTVSQLTHATPVTLRPPAEDTLRAWVDREAVAADGNPRVTIPVDGFLGAATFALDKVVGASVPPLLVLALLGCVLAGPRPRPPPLAWALAAFAAGQILLRANYGYTSRIHASSAGVLVAPLAAVAWARAPWRRLAGGRARLACAATLAAGLVALLPKALDPQQEGRGPQAAVGAWIAARDQPQEVWGIDARVVAHYAGAAYRDVPSLTPGQLVDEARAAGVRWLVVYVRHRAARPEALTPALAAAGARRVDPGFADRAGATRYRWLVFELPAGPIQGTSSR